MSLELISTLNPQIDKNKIDQLIEYIRSDGFKYVYYLEEYSSYGFVHKVDEYTNGSPPLFDLIILGSSVCLAVYGNLNDLEEIRIVITKAFAHIGVMINLEEGEE